MVEYWHWHSLYYGQETYWKGVLSHDLQSNRAYKEVSIIGYEREKIGKKIVNLQKKNKVAILYSIDSNNGLQLQPFDNNFYDISLGPWNNRNAYIKVLKRFYKAFYDLNIEVDFFSPEYKF
ncbi:hypothetical protein ES708_02788 [subsurface metagenome]